MRYPTYGADISLLIDVDEYFSELMVSGNCLDGRDRYGVCGGSQKLVAMQRYRFAERRLRVKN